MKESFLFTLEEIIQQRKNESPEKSYTAELFAKGMDKILQKVGEEAVEYIIDAKNKNRERTVSEAADLLYHLLVSLAANDLTLADIEEELTRRHKK